MWLSNSPLMWPSHIPAIANRKTQFIQPLWASILHATHVSLIYQRGLFHWGTIAGNDKGNFYPLCKCTCTGEFETGLAPLCPHPHPLPSPDSHRKACLLACQPLLPSTLPLEIPPKCILLSLQEGRSVAVSSYRQRVCARQLISQRFFTKNF